MYDFATTIMRIRCPGRRLAAAACIGLCAASLPVFANDSARAWQYDLHDASPSPDDLGKDTGGYESYQDWHVVQGPDVTVEWSSYVDAGERAMSNARFPGYRKLPGLLAPEYWADGRSADQDSGWGHRTPIHYEGFVTKLTRAEDDGIGGADTEHYVFSSKFTACPEGNSEHSHTDVTYDVWVRPDLEFSWAPILPVTPDVRTRVALGDALADHGLVVRIDRRATSFTTRADGSRSEPTTFGEVVWSSGLKPASVPADVPPMISADAADELVRRLKGDPEAMCRSVQKGRAPAAAAEILTSGQQASFVQAMRGQCQRRAAHG